MYDGSGAGAYDDSEEEIVVGAELYAGSGSGDDVEGADAQPAGSLDDVTAGSYGTGSGSFIVDVDETVSNDELDELDEDVELAPSLLRKAVTSPPVDTMPTTVQPSADFSVSFAASAAGSNDDELTVVNSVDMGATVTQASSGSTGVDGRRR